MADYFDSGKFGAHVCYGPFTNSNCTTGESNADLAIGQSTLVVAPMSGSIVAVSARTTAAVETAGTITVKAHKAGTEFGDSAAPSAVISTSNQASYAAVRPGAVTFDAGDTLGLSITTTTTLDPTDSLDIDGWLFVQFDAS